MSSDQKIASWFDRNSTWSILKVSRQVFWISEKRSVEKKINGEFLSNHDVMLWLFDVRISISEKEQPALKILQNCYFTNYLMDIQFRIDQNISN